MGAPTTPAVERPMFLSADKRKISYQSKNGNTITLEFKNSKAPDSLRSMAEKQPKESLKDSEMPKAESQGLWMGLYDTLSFWCMEAVEVAVFGAYDDPPK